MSPAEETEPIEPKASKKGKHKRADSEGSAHDVDELFKEPTEKDADHEERETPKKSSGKKQKEKKSEPPVSPTKARPKAPKAKKRREEAAEDAIFGAGPLCCAC